MSEEVASAFVERRAFEAALTETEMHRAANAALESQLGQAHEATLLAQADAETLAVAVRAWASTHQPMECEECEDLVTLARTVHPGTPLADEVAAARAARWACVSCGAEFPHIPGDADASCCTKCVEVEVLGQRIDYIRNECAFLRAERDLILAAARAWRTARETLNGIADAEATLLAAVAATDD